MSNTFTNEENEIIFDFCIMLNNVRINRIIKI